MARITYTDKEQHHASPLPDEQKWMHVDANEVKDSVNAVYDADAAATGEVMFNDGTGVGKSPDLLFDGILQVGAISDVGQLQLGGATDTAVGTVSSNGTLTVEGQDINVSAGAVTTVSGVVGVAINGETIVAEATNGVDISAASGVRILTANQPRLAFDEDGAMLVSEDAGTAGQVLTSNGADNPPYWAEPDTDITPFLSIQSGSMSGTLREDGTNAGKAKFALVGGDPNLDLVAWSGSAWMVTVGGVVRYTSASDVATPDLATGWTATGGAQPLPVFSPVYGPQGQEAFEGLGMVGLEHRSAFEAPRTLWVNALHGNNATAEVGKQYRPFRTVQAAINAASALTAGNVHIYVLPGDYNTESLTVPAGASGVQDIRLMTFPGLQVTNLNVEAGAYLSVDYIEVSNNTTVNGSLTTYGPVNLGGIRPSAGNFLLYGVTRATSITLNTGAIFVAHGRVTCNSFSGNDAEVYLYRGMESISCDFTGGLVYFDHSNIGEVNLYSNAADITGLFNTVNLSATIMALVTGTRKPAALTDVNILNNSYVAYFGDVGSLYVGSEATIEVESAQTITLDDLVSGPAVCFVTQGRATQSVTMGKEAQLSINGGRVEGTGVTMDEYGELVLSNLVLLSSVTSTNYTGTKVRAYNCQRLIPASISASFPTRIISSPV